MRFMILFDLFYAGAYCFCFELGFVGLWLRGLVFGLVVWLLVLDCLLVLFGFAFSGFG